MYGLYFSNVANPTPTATAPAPPMRRADRALGPAAFALVTLAFFAIDGTLVHSALFPKRPGAFALAATVDLTLGVTLCYWLLVVRPGHARLRTVLPVFVMSVAATALTLPPGYRQLAAYARVLALPAELGILVLIVVGVRRARSRLRASGLRLDVPERIRAALDGGGIYPRVADVMTTEFSLAFYAFAAWRRPPFVPPGARGFSYHRQNAYAAILWTIFFAAVVEMVALHLVLRATAPRVAAIVLAVSILGAVWILGFLRAVQLRPVLVTNDSIAIRSGLQWSVDIPRALIERLEVGRVKTPAKGAPEYLRAVRMGQPNVLLTLREPLIARGPYGTRRVVSVLSLVLDEPRDFERALTPGV
jgi:hypothetical protein